MYSWINDFDSYCSVSPVIFLRSNPLCKVCLQCVWAVWWRSVLLLHVQVHWHHKHNLSQQQDKHALLCSQACVCACVRESRGVCACVWKRHIHSAKICLSFSLSRTHADPRCIAVLSFHISHDRGVYYQRTGSVQPQSPWALWVTMSTCWWKISLPVDWLGLLYLSTWSGTRP